MSTRKNAIPATEVKLVRCGIYTRKSTEEGLQQDFNTLDAQRESAEAYITAHKHEGWLCLSERYDDGGYTGGNLDRPAFQRLMRDVEAGKIDAIVIYKIDRLSRSLTDFARVMEVLERRNVALIAITQSLDTKTSMGRLTLHILLSFAQFEREIISERTRDKMAAARRKGKFAGGKPLLGYDILSSPAGAKLVINEDEAHRVRKIFELYLQHQKLIPVVKELQKRGWTNKLWTTKKGIEKGGRSFDKGTLHHLLTNRTYTGVVTHGDQIYPGEHTAIVDKTQFERVRAILTRNGGAKGAAVKNKYGALLKGIVHCACCDCAMIHTYTAKGDKRYRYYTCLYAQKRGWHTCATKSVPAGKMEQFVVQQIKRVGRDPALLEGTLRQMRQQNAKGLADAQAEQKAVGRELARHHTAMKKAVAMPEPSPERVAELNKQIQKAEQQATLLREQLARLQREQIDQGAVATALSNFDAVWEQLSPREQARVIQLLIDRIDYDGKQGTVSISFHPNGLKTLANEYEVAA